MSGANTTKITIPVEFQDTAKSYKVLITTLQSELSKLKPGTAIYNNIATQLKKAAQLSDRLDLDLNLGISSKGDIAKLEKEFLTLHTLLGSIQDSYNNIDLKNLNINTNNFGVLAQQFGDARKELAQLQAEYQNAQKMSVGQLLAGNTDGLSAFKSTEITKSGLTVFENLNKELEQTQFEADQAKQKVAELQTKLVDLNTQKAAIDPNPESRQWAAQLYNITGKSDSKVGDIRQRLYDAIRDSFTLKGEWRKNADVDTTKALLDAFGLDPTLLETEAKNRLQAIKSAIDQITGKTFNQVRSDNYQLARPPKELAGLEEQINEIQQELTRTLNIEKDIGDTGVLGSLKTKVNTLREALVKAGVLGEGDKTNNYETQISDVTARLEQLEQQIKVVYQQNRTSNVPNTAPSGDGVRAALDVQADADAFKKNLQNSIKHWMSAQQIINLVKDGIRQAYQDIQNLDRAMTNIAVVTDMSVGDLWGKINDYMAIAQQYGVTTQGVYEVSQLYYQQGLSTAEVMAATTETLKMARIAGMDYAEAADAMTVAIRAFKMEMSDAQHVTDVYSKVAAVTASDTEELAIAMSKTASSAESVGSSFENTTAMLAVMIETTRESAQNLGSALKSIISRYGEMKVGLTVDSEGEEIDYNKTDTALKSVGISLKDAQGQFRDFDEVIFELSQKWDSLDKNTQRYLATIMAGNRQQSRFIALVDNWERLDEVANSAQDSEDAGLLQYAKTLDSLESKLSNLSTSFQQFYMSIFNGPVVGWLLEQINNILVGFNKLGNWQSLLNITGFITAIKTLGGAMLNKLSSPLTSVYNKYKEHFAKITALAKTSGRDVAYAQAQSYNEHTDAALATNNGSNSYQPRHASYQRMSRMERFHGVKPTRFSSNQWDTTKGGTSHGTIVSLVGSGIGLLGSTIGSATAKNDRLGGAVWSMLGSAGSGAATGAMAGPWGAIAGAVIGALASLPQVIKAFDDNVKNADKLAKKREETNKFNIERAEKKNEYTTLKGLIDKINTLEKTKYNSEENYQSWISANNSLVEAYPQFIGYIDEAGNTIADLTNASDILKQSFIQAAQANKDYYVAKIGELEQEKINNQDYEYASQARNSMFDDSTQLLRMYDQDGFLPVPFTLSYSKELKGKTTAAYIASQLQADDIDLTQLIQKANAKQELNELETQHFKALKLYGSIVDTDEDGTYEIEKHLQAYIQAEQQLQQIFGTKKAAMQSGINLASLQSSVDDSFSSIEGYSDLVLQLSKIHYGVDNIEELNYQSLANLSQEEYEKIISPFVNLAEEFKDNSNFSTIVNLYGNLTKYTFDELTSILGQFNITPDNDQYEDLYNSYTSAWTEKHYQAQYKILQAIWGDTGNIDEIASYGEFASNQELLANWEVTKDSSIENKQKAYQRYLVEQILENYEIANDLYDKIFVPLHDKDGNELENAGQLKISLDEATQLTNFYTQQQDIVATSNSVLAKQAAETRLEFLTHLYADLSNIDFTSTDPNYDWRQEFDAKLGDKFGDIDYTKWSTEDAINLQNLLVSEDAGTDAWTAKMDTLFAKYKHTIDWSSNELSKILYTNLNTKIATAENKVKTALKDMEDLSDKQSSGFTWEESETLLKKFGENTTWEDIFTINKEGLIILKNFDTALDTLYQKRVEELEQATQGLAIIQDATLDSGLNPFFNHLVTTKNQLLAEDNVITDAEQKNWINDFSSLLIKNGYELDQTTIDSMISWVTNTENPTIDSFLAYIETLIGSNEKLAEYFETQKNILQAETDFNSYFDEHYGAGNARKSLTDTPTLKNIKDYAISANLIEEREAINDAGETYKYYDWEEYFSGLTGITIDSLGDVEITDADSFVRSIVGKNAKEQLTTVEQEWVNSLNSTITSSGKSAISTVKSLGTDAARGKADWASMYNGASYVKQEAQTIATYWTVKDPNTDFTYEYESKEELNKALNELGNVYAEVEMVEEILLTDTAERITYTATELNQTIESYLSHLYRNGNTDENKALLRNLLASSEKYGKAQSYGELKPELRKQLDAEIDAMYVAYANGRVSDIATYNDLIAKYIEGTITKGELIELKELGTVVTGAQTDIADALSKLGTNTVAAYHTAVLEAINTQATKEDIKSAIEDELSAAKKARKAGSIKAYDLSEAQQALEASAGSYTTDTLDDWYTAWVMQAPETNARKISAEQFYSLFKYDEELQTWLYDATNNTSIAAQIILDQLTEKEQKTFTNAENLRAALQAESDATNFSSAYTSLFKDLSNVTLESIKKLYESVYGSNSFSKVQNEWKSAVDEAQSGSTKDLKTKLTKFYSDVLTGSNIKFAGEIDQEKIAAELKDIQDSLVSTILDNVASAFEGSLSNAGMLQLGRDLGIDNIEQYFVDTIDGYQATKEGMLKFGTEMSKQFGSTYKTAQQMYDLFVGKDKLYSGYQELEEAAAKILAENENLTDEHRKQYTLLQQMAKISRQSADDATFNFMGQDSTRGWTENADTLLESIDTVKTAFGDLSSKKSIDFQDFYNLMDFMYKNTKTPDVSDEKWLINTLGIGEASLSKLIGATDTAQTVYEDFITTMISSSKKFGEIDGKALVKLGISVDTMSKGMSKSLETVAKDQIAYLESVREMLVAFQALENLPDISLGLSIYADNGKGEELTLDNLFNWQSLGFSADDVKNAVDAKMSGIEKALDEAFKGTDLAGKWGEIIKRLFSGDGEGFTATSSQDISAAMAIGNFFENIHADQLSPDQYASLAADLVNQLYDGDKLRENWEEILSQYILDYAPETLHITAPSTVEANIAATIEGVASIEGGYITLDKDQEFTRELEAEIRAAYQEAGYNKIEFQFTPAGTYKVHIVDAKVQTIIDSLNTNGSEVVWNQNIGNYSIKDTYTLDGDTINYQIKISSSGAVSYVDESGNAITDKQALEAIQGAASETLGEAGVTLTTTAEGINAVTDSVASGADTASTSVATLEENLQNIYTLLSSGFEGVTFNFSVGSDAETAATVLDSIAKALKTIQESAQLESTVKVNDEDKTIRDAILNDIITIEANHTANFFAQKDDTTYNAVEQALNELARGRTATIYVKKQEESSNEESNSNDDSEKSQGTGGSVGPRFAKGNVALAKGSSLDKLQRGAALAQGTLMGELGPELYVQGGHYYIAGANGPEFVDLANDAIVFNHLQTKSLLNKGQTPTTGSPVTSERRAVGAYATGNVKGHAFAGGTGAAIAAIDRAIAVWQNILNVSAKELVGAGGGGGGDTKAHIEDLEEWYNLSRKIANVEQEINNIIAERENMADGHEYLRSLRLQQELLQEQIGYQETLLNYQELQLKRQADVINTDKLWSQFIHVDETGLLQYNKGNEINGGKGALEVLQDLNEMSGKDQIAFLNKIGYKYTTTDGKELEGSELVAKFFEELQKQIDEYDALYDTVHETNETIEGLKTSIEEINQEIIDNQLELETEIYDLIVEAWEKEIKKMEEYADKVEEANQKYIDGLQDALDAEKDLYDKNQSVEDRETLQRQLALLRRSGGSASEIADLEAELDNMLKDEYFTNQQEAIDNIQKVNEAQLEALQQQIQLEEDALAFQQEHGLIWNQVNEIMQGGFDSMMNFFTAKDNEFFEASALAQIEKLDDWAKRVGIYDEDQAHQKHEDKAAANYWDNNAIWSDASLAGMQQVFNSMADGDKKAIKDTFLNAYANAKMSGKSEDEAKAAGINSITSALNAEKERQARAAQQSISNTVQNTPAPSTHSEPAKPETRYVYMWAGTPDGEGKVSKIKRYGLNITADAKLADARRIITGYIKRAGYLPSSSTVYGFSEGGLVDYTGPAIVHGTPARPEGFLNAEQTAQIREALVASGDSTLLNILRSVASQLKVVSGAVSNSVSNNRSIEIAQGAVQVQVGTLANSYDVEDLSNDIMGRIVAIADKSTNRSVGRR